MDAMPLRFDQELGGWARQLRNGAAARAARGAARACRNWRRAAPRSAPAINGASAVRAPVRRGPVEAHQNKIHAVAGLFREPVVAGRGGGTVRTMKTVACR